MLKRLIINQNIIPVPVPLRNLAEVCSWVDETLVEVGKTVTSASLDGRNILELWGHLPVCESVSIHPDMRLELRVESPEELALQSLDAIHSLCFAILSGIKSLAVHLWQARKNDIQPELVEVIDDIDLVARLIDRLRDMGIDRSVELGKLIERLTQLQKILNDLNRVKLSGDWKDAAQILLRDSSVIPGLETVLRSVSAESKTLHEALTAAVENKLQGAKIGLK
jgi:hypothetical protein